jgi:hypothetical protein
VEIVVAETAGVTIADATTAVVATAGISARAAITATTIN